jgi:ribosomal protein L23
MKTIWDVIKAPVVTEKAVKAKGDFGSTSMP